MVEPEPHRLRLDDIDAFRPKAMATAQTTAGGEGEHDRGLCARPGGVRYPSRFPGRGPLAAPPLLLPANPGLFPKVFCLAPAEELERGFDTFVVAGVCVGEELVDLEPSEFFAGHVAGLTCTVPSSVTITAPCGATMMRLTMSPPAPSGSPLGGLPKPWLRGCRRVGAVRREDYLELVERCTYRDDRVRPA
jgi:hypothetical protein